MSNMSKKPSLTRTKVVAIIGGSLIIITVVVGITILLVGSSTPDGMRQVNSYKRNSSCLALSPECSYCPGDVIEKKCYVRRDDPSFDKYR